MNTLSTLPRESLFTIFGKNLKTLNMGLGALAVGTALLCLFIGIIIEIKERF